MARRRRKRAKFNPTGLETGLIAAGTMVLGGVGGFLLASWGCNRLLQTSLDQGILEFGPNSTLEGVMGPSQPTNGVY